LGGPQDVISQQREFIVARLKEIGKILEGNAGV
jgi:hypothetical protein